MTFLHLKSDVYSFWAIWGLHVVESKFKWINCSLSLGYKRQKRILRFFSLKDPRREWWITSWAGWWSFSSQWSRGLHGAHLLLLLSPHIDFIFSPQTGFPYMAIKPTLHYSQVLHAVLSVSGKWITSTLWNTSFPKKGSEGGKDLLAQRRSVAHPDLSNCDQVTAP